MIYGWILLAGAALAVAFGLRSSSGAAAPSVGPWLPAKKEGRTLNDALLSAVLELLPTASTVLRPGDAALDPVYGGRRADAFGAPAWGYYQRKIASGSGGTTCGTVLAYWMGRAGWPLDMIDRAPTDPVAPGASFTPGLSVSKIIDGAKRRGWYQAGGMSWQPGDAYHVDHPPRVNSDHVGAVVSVSAPRADGTRIIETGDGGQGDGADVKRNLRTLSADGSTLTLDGVPARVLGTLRATPQAIA